MKVSSLILIVIGALVAYASVAWGQTPAALGPATSMSTGNPAIDIGITGATLLAVHRLLDVVTPLIKSKVGMAPDAAVALTATTICSDCRQSINEMHSLICARTEDGTYRWLGDSKARDNAMAANTQALEGLTEAVRALVGRD